VNNFNDFLWNAVNDAGWWWWGPCIIIAIKNLVILANLSAPITTIGRIARGFAWMAHIPLAFVGIVAVIADLTDIPVSLNGLGPFSMPLLLIANNALYIQLWLACREQKRNASPNKAYGVQRILNKMVQ
jgi:hypothetical protein